MIEREGMKKTIWFVATVVFAGCVSAAWAEPYAEVASLPPKNSEFYGLWEMTLSEIQVPERASVTVPPYPGARIVSVMKAGDPDVSGPRATPKIVLLSVDGRKEIATFYRKALPGWKQGSDQQADFFWTDSETFAIGPIAYKNTPSVIIQDIKGMGPMDIMEKSLMPQARTRITVIYKVGK